LPGETQDYVLAVMKLYTGPDSADVRAMESHSETFVYHTDYVTVSQEGDEIRIRTLLKSPGDPSDDSHLSLENLLKKPARVKVLHPDNSYETYVDGGNGRLGEQVEKGQYDKTARRMTRTHFDQPGHVSSVEVEQVDALGDVTGVDIGEGEDAEHYRVRSIDGQEEGRAGVLRSNGQPTKVFRAYRRVPNGLQQTVDDKIGFDSSRILQDTLGRTVSESRGTREL